MTPLEGELLQRLALDHLQNIVGLSISGFFYGVFVVLFSASVVIFARKGFSNRATTAMFITTITNFILSSLKAGTEVAGFVVFIRQTLIVNPNYPLSEKPELVINVLRGVVALGVWAANFPVLLSDLVVIWRAWALFPNRQWVVLIPFILWIGTVGVVVGDLIWISIPNDYDQLTSNVSNSLSTASIALSMATNAVTTMMIAHTLWSYCTFSVMTPGLKSPVQTVLILLVESGLVCLGFQIVCLVLNAYYGSPFVAKVYGFNEVYYSAVAMYPTLVIVLVETQRSMVDICEIIPSNASKFAGPQVSEARPATFGHLSSKNQDEQEHDPEKVILEVKECVGLALVADW